MVGRKSERDTSIKVFPIQIIIGLGPNSAWGLGAMRLAEILRAVEERLPVHWQNPSYVVERPMNQGYCVTRSLSTGNCIGRPGWTEGH